VTNEEQSIERLHIHIEGLEGTLRKRNAKIAELEAKLADPSLIDGPLVKRAYKNGWQACANELSKATLDAATHLKQIKNEAWQMYIRGEQTLHMEAYKTINE
jgi:hypothetical protein